MLPEIQVIQVGQTRHRISLLTNNMEKVLSKHGISANSSYWISVSNYGIILK